jgi:hypothetical protein
VAKKKRVWPDWWNWEIKISSHMQKRLLKRDFTEIELRRMMEYATNFREDYKEGRWIIDTRFRRSAWQVIVEPLHDETKLEVITAYEVTDE